MLIQIKNIKIIDPSTNTNKVGDIFVEDKKIVNKLSAKPEKIIDGKNKIAVPGLIDVHCHLREPGQEEKETIKTGTMSAAKGGITTVFCMPNTKPVTDNAPSVEYILMKAQKEGKVNVFPIGCITKGSLGKELAEIDCEDKELSRNGVMNAGKNSMIFGLRGIPKQSEEIMVSRDIMLCELTGGKLHIAHVSTAGSVELVRQAKKKGLNVTCETCPHYFSLTDDYVQNYDTSYKMNPPLRTQADVEAIKDGLKDGTIDCIATDHAPHTLEEKSKEFDLAPFGIIGFETALLLILSELVDKKVLTLEQAISKMTTNPAKIFSLTDRGTLKAGSIADMTIIDLQQEYEFKKEDILSKSKNSPFIGRKFKGCAVTTIVGGKIIWTLKDGIIN